MIYLGLGANLPGAEGEPPAETITSGLMRLAASGLQPVRISGLYESAPVPRSDQPWYVNCVAAVMTALTPQAALALCLATEAEFGRVRSVANAARTLDIDIIAWNDERIAEADLAIPHPRMAERAFVLLPLAEIAPDWRHPGSGEAISALVARLPPGQEIRHLIR
jgi:2-amino-4-hydroxy-6-hydroxymethyldihydropteridine diphosphokinase